jgi:hypothetical protein
MMWTDETPSDLQTKFSRESARRQLRLSVLFFLAMIVSAFMLGLGIGTPQAGRFLDEPERNARADAAPMNYSPYSAEFSKRGSSW